jgi:hypothetical protein
MSMSNKHVGGLALLLGLVVVLATTGVMPWAVAKPAPPPPPGSTSPPGPDSTFYFNAYGPSPNDDVVLRWTKRPSTPSGPAERPGGGRPGVGDRAYGHL